jgi:hypothetical protein
MKQKITSFIIATMLVTGSLFATNMSGTYKVGTTEGAHYASLSAAVAAINAATIEGDIVLEITSDITEATNFGLAKDFGTNKLTIRPDADAERTITFTQATANTFPLGHFVIGYLTAGFTAAVNDTYHIGTSNVTIDGYAVGGTTKRLKFTTSAASLAGSSLITVYGDADNVTIKNCFLENKSTAATPRAIYYYARTATGTIEAVPDNLTIDNNHISSMGSSTGQGIVGVNSGTGSSRPTNMSITNNYVIAQGRCMEIHYFGSGLLIQGNEIKLSQQASSGTTNYGLWVRTGVGPVNIIGNKFTEVSTKEAGTTGTLGTRAISCGALEHNIFNNTFSGMNRTGAATVNVAQSYVFLLGTGKVYNNTFYMPALTASGTPGEYVALQTQNSKVYDIKNNIFISDDDNKAVFIRDINTTAPNYNIYHLRAGNTNARVVSTFATLEAYQTANPTLDINSKSVNVTFEDAAAGDLRIAGLSIQDMNLEVPKLAEVPTDMFGTVRANMTYAGAHQSVLPFIDPSTGTKNPGMNVMIQNTTNGIQINLDRESSVEIYTVNGMLIDKAIATGTYSRALDSGVYILRINGNASKFVR